MSGKVSSLQASQAAGSAGLAGFARSLSASWRTVLPRFLLAFVGLGLVWVVAAPLYASLLVIAATPFRPLLERSPGVTYEARGGKVVALRPLVVQQGTQAPKSATVQQGLWNGAVTFNVALLAAAILTTPGWRRRERGRAIAI